MAVAVKSTAPADARYWVKGTAYHRVMEEAAFYARCSDNKTAMRVRPRRYSVCYPYIQINRPGMVSWLIFDLDHANSLIWEEKGLPPPNFMVRNPANGHCHLYYAIEPVCTSEAARQAPIAYMRAIYAAMALELEADQEYRNGSVAKTPGHPWWHTVEYHASVYCLGDLADCVEFPESKPWAAKGPDINDVSHSRHCIMFEKLRFYAYSIVNDERESGSFDQFVRRLEAYAYNHNEFSQHGFAEATLPSSSLRATVKSVSRWTWFKYYGNSRCHRGVMGLDKSLPLTERQSLAAERTHSVRQKATESKVRQACRGLLQRGEKLTHVAIAALVRVSRQTIAKYTHIIAEVLSPSPVVVPLVAAGGAAPGVKFGVHQVPAVAQPAVDLLDLEPSDDPDPPGW